MFTSRWCQETQALKHNTFFFPLLWSCSVKYLFVLPLGFPSHAFFFFLSICDQIRNIVSYLWSIIYFVTSIDLFSWGQRRSEHHKQTFQYRFLCFFFAFFFKVNIKKLYMGLHSTSIKRWKMPNWCDFEQDVTMLLVEESREISLDIQVHLREHRE